MKLPCVELGNTLKGAECFVLFCLEVRRRQEVKERTRSRVMLSKKKQKKNERERQEAREGRRR